MKKTQPKMFLQFLTEEESSSVPRFQRKFPEDTIFYLYGALEEPEKYVDLIQTLREAEEGQQIQIHVNGPGGYLSSCLAIVNAMMGSEAEVITVLDGEASSAHAFIWLAGDQKVVASPHTSLMVHEACWGFEGKIADHQNQVKITKKLTYGLIDQLASWLLTEEEMEDVKKGVDVHIHGSELIERSEKLIPEQE